MLKSCFGLCSLRSGINVIAFFNMITISAMFFIRLVLYFLVFVHQVDYPDMDIMHSSNESLREGIKEQKADDDKITVPLVSWHDAKMSSMWIFSTWIVLILITNVCLKQSTFKQALHKIYAWLVINYATLLYLAIHMFKYIVLLRKFTLRQILGHVEDPFVGDLFANFLLVVLFAMEIFTVHSYYVEANKAKLNDVIQLKWRHVSNGVVLARGTGYPTAVDFQETVSRQTQEQSRTMPPYVTAILADRY